MIHKISVILRYIRTVLNLKTGQEAEITTFDEIKAGVDFKGTNFWIMSLAILIACIGLNINSKAAVIGAMIISPIMGPIFGIGFSLGTSNVTLLKLSFKNIFRIVFICVFSSSLYYLLSPYHIPTEELKSFAKPTIFDILLAFFGGMAGMIAISRQDGNRVLVGIAVATACIPPLCTAGFGIARLQWEYVLGGMYTYFINALFICLGSYLITRYLKFARYSNDNIRHITGYFGILVVIALIPGIYLAYNLYMVNNYKDKVTYFIANEIEKTHHVIHTSIDEETKYVTVDVVVDQYEDTLSTSIVSLLRKNGLQDTHLYIFQTIRAVNNKSQIYDLQKQINELKKEMQKVK